MVEWLQRAQCLWQCNGSYHMTSTSCMQYACIQRMMNCARLLYHGTAFVDEDALKTIREAWYVLTALNHTNRMRLYSKPVNYCGAAQTWP